MQKSSTSFLVFLFMICILGLLAVERLFVTAEPRADVLRMKSASILADEWLSVVEAAKKENGIISEVAPNMRHGRMLGDEFSDITTTLGSLDAKETTLNPEFAALMVRLLDDAGIDSTSTVGVTLSSSFPSLAISSLAALQTIGARAIVISSLGASMYGANQPQATWIDMERWLGKSGRLRYRSQLVTMGAEGDSGGGLSEGGVKLLKEAATRNGIELFMPASLGDAIERRVQLFRHERINLLINIGGNQANLGGCVHASSIPNGYHRTVKSCNDPDRGVLVRMSEMGLPVIHLLNIRELSTRYEVNSKNAALYDRSSVEQVPVVIFLIIVFGLLVGFSFMRKRHS